MIQLIALLESEIKEASLANCITDSLRAFHATGPAANESVRAPLATPLEDSTLRRGRRRDAGEVIEMVVKSSSLKTLEAVCTLPLRAAAKEPARGVPLSQAKRRNVVCVASHESAPHPGLPPHRSGIRTSNEPAAHCSPPTGKLF